MKKNYYVKVDQVNRIVDILTQSKEGFVQVLMDSPPPINIMGGAYQLIDENSVIYRPEWDTNKDIEAIKAALEMTQATVDEIILNGGIV